MRASLAHRATAFALLAATCVGGCLLVTPLDDVPVAGAGAAAHGGSAGNNGRVIPNAGEPAGAAGDAPDSGLCNTNADCADRGAGAPYHCRKSDHACMPLLSEVCPLSYGDAWSNPNAILFGAFATLTPLRPGDNSIIWAHRLALQELNGQSIGGLPGGPKGARRPLVMVVCDNKDASVAPAVRHLVEDLEVPAVLATLKPNDLRTAFEEHAADDVFYLSPVSVTSNVATEADDARIWNILGQPRDFAPTYKALLLRAEAHVRKQRKLEMDEPIKVALISTEDAFDSELANEVTPGLVINGKSASADKANFVRFDIPEKPDYELEASKIGAFAPDIVVSAASDKFSMMGGLQEQLESDWPTYFGLPPKERPFYILSPYDVGNVAALRRRIEGQLDSQQDVDDQHRYVGVSIAAPTDTTLQNTYGVRLATAFDGKAIADTANYYDALYYLAYAMVGASEPGGLTGSGIARGMQRLLSGKSFDLGPTTTNEIFAALAKAGTTVDVRSTLGPPSFDAVTGVRPVAGSVFCFERTVNKVALLPDQLRYDGKTFSLVGEFPCIPGF